jgi:hypothetical protein
MVSYDAYLLAVSPAVLTCLALLGTKRGSHLVAETLLVRLLGNLVGAAAHNPAIMHHQILLLKATSRLLCGSVPDLGATANCKFVFRHSIQTQENILG